MHFGYGMKKILLENPLTVLPVSVFIAVAGSKGWGSAWMFGDLVLLDWLLMVVGAIGIIGSVSVLSKRPA